MSQKLIRGYRFATEEQWNACLFTRADRDSREARNGLHPFNPYAGPAIRFESKGGSAPTVSHAGEVLWRDDERNLRRLFYSDDKQVAVKAPYAIARATRLVANSKVLWAAAAAPESLQAFELESLTRQLTVEIPNARVLDIADDGHDGLFVLIERNHAWEFARYDCAGELRLDTSFALTGVSDPSMLVYLRRVDQLIILASNNSKLHFFSPDSGSPKFSLPISAVRPCFDVVALGSDDRAVLFIAGTDGQPFGGLHHVLTLNADGDLLGEVELDEKPTGVTGNRTTLLVTTARGILRFKTSNSVPRDSFEVKTALMTPMLQSPPTNNSRRWLRVEATAKLPAGSTLEISYASTDNREIRDEALRLAKDRSIRASQRLQRLRSNFGKWRTFTFHGDGMVRANESAPLSAPLFDVHEQYLWISITLIASPGGGIPVVSELAVLYPGRTLMENLPAMYQRTESQSGSFLRSLVGVLESTTQTLDARIGDMGRHVHPQTAPGPWLDFVARWLGLPWDDALSLDQKRAIAKNAAVITKGRGTKAGLEALLASLMPGKPQRFRVVDGMADFGLATIGGDACRGSSLPVILGGLPSTATELGSKAILGKARLPCAESYGETSRLVGQIRVDVSVNAHEKMSWEPWLGLLIHEMLPATTRLQLRWLSVVAFRQEIQLDDALQIESAPEPHLGTDAVTGIARLPERRGILLSSPGTDSGGPLH